MKHLTSLLVLSSLCSFIPQSYAMGEKLGGDVAEEDRFYLDMEPYAARKARADKIIQNCNREITCVDKIIRRDNPDVKFKDYGKPPYPIERAYGVDRTKFLFLPYSYGIGMKINRKTNKIIEYGGQ
jgi:hypothetical protein